MTGSCIMCKNSVLKVEEDSFDHNPLKEVESYLYCTNIDAPVDLQGRIPGWGRSNGSCKCYEKLNLRDEE